jgi:cold shock CspA family protein
VEEEAQQTITTTDRLTGGPVFGGINVAERGADFVEQEITDSPCTYEIAREQDAEIVFSAVWKGTEEATLQVALNGSQLVSETLAATDAFVHKQAVFSAGTVMLQEGDVLTISYQGSDGDTNAEAYIDYMSLQAGEAIAATGLLFNAGQQQGQTVQWQGPWNQNTEIWNVTTPLNVVNQIKATENYFRTQTDDIQRFVAFDRSAGDGVEDFQGTLSPVEGQDLYAMETPQIFIITNANLAGRAEALAQRHRQDRRAATVVDVAQIYRNFSGDGTDFTAIRNFLAHHYQQSETLEYVTLFGDASVYPHDDRFIVPAYQSSGEWNEMMITAGDLFYGFLEDGEDFMLSEADMDIAVGRIPVATDAEAQDYLIKAEAYDHQGHWKTDFVMLADDKDNHIHMDTQENLATVLSEEVKVMNKHKIYF